MKKNRLASLLAILLFTLSLEMLGTETNYVAANSSPSISITPKVSKTLLYDSLDINLSISDVTDLYLWAMTIEWNSTILNLLDYSEGPFLQQGGQTTFLYGEITAGKIEGLTCSLLGPVQGVDGSGTLATLQFNATAISTTSLNITFSDLLDSEGNSIVHGVINGTVNVRPRILTYVFIRKYTATHSFNDSDPVPLHTVSYNETCDINFSLPDVNGVINLTIPKESYQMEPFYDPVDNVTRHWFLTSDANGKMYTLNGTGDVDIISMTNDTGKFFWKDGAWHPRGEEWIGDGTPDPAGSAWMTGTLNFSVYSGNDTSGPPFHSALGDFWGTTGFMENIVVEPASRLNGSYMNVTGFPFTGVGGIGGFASTGADLNTPWADGLLDSQRKDEILEIIIPSFSATLSSPANLYVTDPENRHIGTDPTTGKPVNQIPKAFYSGTGSHPQRIIIPDPLDGVYDIKIVGTRNGSYALVVELTTLEKKTTHTYTGDIAAEQILESEANVSEGEMTFTRNSNIAISDIILSKTVVGQGYSVSIDVTVENQGNYTENFDVTAYANTTIIDTLINITLTSGNSTTLTFTWKTTDIPYGKYTITANATLLPYETDLTDNTETEGWVRVTGVGDVNGDGTVNVLDIILVLINVGPVPPSPPQCDINCDNTIDVLDVILALINVGPV